MDTPLNDEPDVLMDTDCDDPENDTAIAPEMPPPLIARLRLPWDARPETPPEALNVRSSQSPETRPCEYCSADLRSIFALGEAQRSAKPNRTPPAFTV